MSTAFDFPAAASAAWQMTSRWTALALQLAQACLGLSDDWWRRRRDEASDERKVIQSDGWPGRASGGHWSSSKYEALSSAADFPGDTTAQCTVLTTWPLTWRRAASSSAPLTIWFPSGFISQNFLSSTKFDCLAAANRFTRQSSPP